MIVICRSNFFPARTWHAAVLVLLCALTLLQPLARTEEAVPLGLEIIPKVVAEVNGVPILRNDLLREMVASAGNEALERIVRRILVEQAASAAGATAKVTPELIEQQFVIDKRDLMAELIKMPWDKTKEFPIGDIIRTRYRMSVEEYKSLMIRKRLLTQACVGRDLDLTEDNLLRYFASHMELFQPPTMYRASHILISWFDPRDFHRGLRMQNPAYQAAQVAQDRRKRIDLKRDHNIEFKDDDNADLLAPVKESRQSAEKLLREIRSGTISWDQAVRKFSQDPLDKEYTDAKGRKHVAERERLGMLPGEVGWFHAGGPLEPDFYRGAKDMKPGEIGGPVQTIYGFHLIRMLEIKNPPTVTFEQVRDKVERLYVESEIRTRSDAWMKGLLENAVLQSEPVLLWPPRTGRQVKAADGKDEDPDPIVGSVNGTTIRRSDIWRELFRSESDDSLDRLIHFQIVMTMLKKWGIDRLEWESADTVRRSPSPPPARPVLINAERIDLELNDDRLRNEKEAPDMSFSDFIYLHYGQSVDEYRQKIEAGLIVRDSIRDKVKIDEKTLVTEWALAKEAYYEPAWYELSHILLVPSGGMDRADKTAMLSAVTIADQVRRNYIANPTSEAWNKLVQDYSMASATNKSRDGNLGPCYSDVRSADFPEGPMLYAEVNRQKLQKGQVSVPIRTFRGYHIVRVDAVHAGVQPEFKQVRARVERDYLQERAKMCTDVWLRALSFKAKITRNVNVGNNPGDPGRLPPDKFPLPKE